MRADVDDQEGGGHDIRRERNDDTEERRDQLDSEQERIGNGEERIGHDDVEPFLVLCWEML